MSSTRDASASPAADALSGRTALVTGASRGIGRATARLLAGAGARVAMFARDTEALEGERAFLGDRALPIPCDVAERGSVERAVSRVRDALGGAPDILVHVAGRFALARIEETTAESFTETLDVNLVAPFLITTAFVREMRERGRGDVVSVGSIADRHTFPENGAYAASKFGLRAMHQVLRDELRGSGVRVTLVSPGPTDTPLWDAVEPEVRPGFTPRARMLDAAAVADAILYVVTRPAGVNVDELRLSRS